MDGASLMIYYKNTNGEVFAYETQAEKDQYGSPDLVKMAPVEVQEHINPAPVPLTLEQVQALRQSAYVAESDPLKIEAEYDAIVEGTDPDYAKWLSKVTEIKARFTLP